MTDLLRNTLIVIGCGLLLLTGCGTKQESVSTAEDVSNYQVTCIGVLPAVPKENIKSLQKGVLVMDGLLSRELSSQTNVRFVGSNDLSGLQVTGDEKTIDIAKMVGKSINCNTVLESKVVRFQERVGGRYSVEKPASVAFEMRLIGVDTGTILWTAKFDEEQKSVFENLYDWGKARMRGFTWITAEELMREGLREKLDSCTYFQKARGKGEPVAMASPESNI